MLTIILIMAGKRDKISQVSNIIYSNIFRSLSLSTQFPIPILPSSEYVVSFRPSPAVSRISNYTNAVVDGHADYREQNLSFEQCSRIHCISSIQRLQDEAGYRRTHRRTWPLPLIRCCNPNPLCLHIADVVREIA